MTDSHNQTNINLAPEQGVTSIVFAPNADPGTNENDGLKFTDFGAMVDQITAFPGLYDVYLDPGPLPATGAAPQVTIPAGTYDLLNRVRFVGPRQVNQVIITDVVLNNLLGAEGIDFIHEGTGATPVFSSTVAGDSVFLEFENCTFSQLAGATVPIFEASGNGGILTLTFDRCNVTNLSGTEPFNADDALSGFVVSANDTVFGSDSVSVFEGAGTLAISIDSNSVLWVDAQTIDTSGTLNVTARRQTYYVATADAADWAAPVPENYQDAIRRIASVVAGAHGAIPV